MTKPIVKAGALLTAGAIVLIGGQALSAPSTPAASSSNTIRACVVKKTGEMRLLKNGSCGRKAKELVWNRVGPAGQTGARGPQGNNGDQGPQGVPGTSGATGPTGPSNAYYTQKRPFTTLGTSNSVVVSLNLPAGAYTVSMAANATGAAQSDWVACQLQINGNNLELPATSTNITGVNYTHSIGIETAVTLDQASRLDVACQSQNGGNVGQVGFSAIRVAALNIQ